MALEFCESFMHSSSLTPKWTSSGGITVASSTPRYSGGSYGYLSSQYAAIYKSGLTSSPTYWIGMAYRWAASGDNSPLLAFLEDGSRQMDSYVDPAGTLKFVKYTGSESFSAPIAQISNAFTSGIWAYIEVKVTIHSSAGVLEFRKNGETLYSGSSLNTRNYGLNINGVSPIYTNGNASLASGSSFCDFYACSDTGSDNKDFLGDVRVQAIFPSGAGTTTQMTPSAGSNYACVDDASPNGDTDYVSETTAGEKDTYAFGNLTPTSGTVKGVQILVNARKDDAGSRSIAPVWRPVSTDYDGTTVSIGDSYDYVRQVKDVSPETSSAWTISEVNGAEFGVKLIA